MASAAIVFLDINCYIVLVYSVYTVQADYSYFNIRTFVGQKKRGYSDL